MLNLKKYAAVWAVLFVLSFAFSTVVFADELILEDLNSKPVNLSSYKGKPLILFFWTTWCPYCRKEIKALNQSYPQFKKEGITLFAVDVGEPGYKVQNFFKNYALNFKVLLDKDALAADKYDIVGVPTYILIDKKGQVITHENTLPADYKNLLLK